MKLPAFKTAKKALSDDINIIDVYILILCRCPMQTFTTTTTGARDPSVKDDHLIYLSVYI